MALCCRGNGFCHKTSEEVCVRPCRGVRGLPSHSVQLLLRVNSIQSIVSTCYSEQDNVFCYLLLSSGHTAVSRARVHCTGCSMTANTHSFNSSLCDDNSCRYLILPRTMLIVNKTSSSQAVCPDYNIQLVVTASTKQ